MFFRRRPPILFWLGAFFFVRQLMRHRHGGYGGYGRFGRPGGNGRPGEFV